MATYTSRMGLIKPAGSEPRAVGPIASDMDLIDKFMPCILVNDGVTPPTVDLYDGALVKERTSGIIWEARKNGGGTFDKVYVRYPYHIEMDSNQKTIVTGSDGQVGADPALFVAGNCKNATVGQINGVGEWVCPVKGSYQISMNLGFASNATGVRGIRWGFNGEWILDDSSQVVVNAVNGSNTHLHWGRSRIFNVGDRVVLGCIQTSGGNLTVRGTFQATMLEPIQ